MLLSPPSPLNFVMNSLDRLGKDWLGSLKSLKISLPSLPIMLYFSNIPSLTCPSHQVPHTPNSFPLAPDLDSSLELKEDGIVY
jgi:hypothetical protein